MTGIIKFDDIVDSWGVGGWVARALLRQAIEQVGSKEYLLQMQVDYERNFGIIEFNTLSLADAHEFRGIVQNYLDSGRYLELVTRSDLVPEFSDSFTELISKIDAYLKYRIPN